MLSCVGGKNGLNAAMKQNEQQRDLFGRVSYAPRGQHCTSLSQYEYVQCHAAINKD
jgi:hypothetical protein